MSQGDQMSIGKTIAWIDEEPRDPKYGGEEPRDPKYGGEDRGALIIHFTDGTALHIEGHSHEEVDISLNELTAEDVRRRSLAVQGQREKARLDHLKRQEWLSVSCDERKRRRDLKRAQQGPMARLMNEEFEGVLLDTFVAHNRMLYGGGPVKVRLRCPRCGERQCENAPIKEHKPVQHDGPRFGGVTVSIPIAGTDAAF